MTSPALLALTGAMLFGLGAVLGAIWRTRTIYRRGIDEPVATTDFAEMPFLEQTP